MGLDMGLVPSAGVDHRFDPEIAHGRSHELAVRDRSDDARGRRRHRVHADDMPAHLRAALTQSQLAIPVESGRMALGTWQGIYLFEHRRAPHRRAVVLHVIGE